MENLPDFPSPTGLPTQKRYITTHDATGRSVFANEIDPTAVYERVNPKLDFFLAYANTTFPAEMNDDFDIAKYKGLFAGPQPPISIPGGTVLRVCNFAPGSVTPMHRTLSLDYGIVIAGQVELVLDSGETKLLEPGDIAVQRGTMHAWRTPHGNTWSRMVFILQEGNALELDGQALEEDYGGLDLVPGKDFRRQEGK
ncbi:Cupin, RmlC-type [Cordyceps fumosorosea ARSEF 2679]|uniref:Cupin, RmlC-type n=1 Tax=Cordyceps fumosorosea (strain ARSEF 2679) TaxID=1081104 RepID=A0A167LVS1_CORFA|nr:Cupin, RmlC-type [Cordyceps fumosorosea ARSEF 2679]OAA53579.1 Cupin, RmlC-type [Cordyceps fumosorosea ARSEF 2679]